MTVKYHQHLESKQTSPIFGREAEMRQNNAGGFTFVLDNWKCLQRFLLLGSEGGTYYQGERELTLENAAKVLLCIQEDGIRTVQTILDISESGRAPKNDPAIFALALAMKKGNDATRKAARAAVPRVCRIGTHILHLAAAVKSLGGWGSGTQKAFGRWYQDKTPNTLAYQLAKYQQRDGWSHRDVLRLAKPKGHSKEINDLLRWATHGDVHPSGSIMEGMSLAKGATPQRIVQLIQRYGLPRECLPTESLMHKEVWEVLLHNMGLTALIRNLGKMTSVGLLSPMSDAEQVVRAKLGDAEEMRISRVHPLAILMAMKVYGQGHGNKGSLIWAPSAPVMDALDAAFYAAFENVPRSQSNWYLGLDVSGSMGAGPVAGLSAVTPREASAAMALVTAKTTGEGAGYVIRGFGHTLVPLHISPSQRLDDAVRTISGLDFGGTDCALPMLDAAKHKMSVDAFVVYTDNETWAGGVHPSVALDRYQQTMGRAAKLIVVGMTGTEFTIADPTRSDMLDVVGFDTTAPAVMADFVEGKV